MTKHKGQVAIEYLLLLAMFALITLVSLSAFFPRVKAVGENLFQQASERIVK